VVTGEPLRPEGRVSEARPAVRVGRGFILLLPLQQRVVLLNGRIDLEAMLSLIRTTGAKYVDSIYR
jgi:hypothetical protein